jgi:phosphate transport system permease protein
MPLAGASIVPYADLGILGSIFLGLARALEETMAVTMVIGNAFSLRASLLVPGPSIAVAAVIASEFTEATGQVYSSALARLGLVQFGLTIISNGIARLIIIATSRKGNRRA